MEGQLLVSVKEAARRLGLGRSFTYRLVQTGRLRSIKIGGSRRIVVADLAEFVERLRSEPVEAVDQ